MGLQTWKNSPWQSAENRYYIAKNYLIEKEINDLNRIVTMYLDYAENQAARQIPMKMEDWVMKLDAFLQFNEYQILKDAGKVSQEVAEISRERVREIWVVQDQHFECDFDKEVKKLKPKPGKK